jgi:hypothetical protein
MPRILFLLVLLCSALSAADAPTLPAKEAFHIYLLCGQSNMAGRGVPEEQDKTPHPRVLVLNQQDAWAPAVDPLHWDKPKVAGVGPGLTFGKTMAEANPKITIGLVPCAVGGSPIEQWQPDAKLFKDALARAKLAAPHGVIKGILWHQGESNAANTTEAYAAKIKNTLEGFRKELNNPTLPIVVGELADFKKGYENVNAALEAVPKNIPHTAFVETKGLKHKGDNLHFDAASEREIGKRYAAAMQKLVK